MDSQLRRYLYRGLSVLPVAAMLHHIIFYSPTCMLNSFDGKWVDYFIPLSKWIWDIPFTSRIICREFHDGRFRIGSVILRSKGIYAFCFVLFAIALVRAWRARRSATPAVSAEDRRAPVA